MTLDTKQNRLVGYAFLTDDELASMENAVREGYARN